MRRKSSRTAKVAANNTESVNTSSDKTSSSADKISSKKDKKDSVLSGLPKGDDNEVKDRVDEDENCKLTKTNISEEKLEMDTNSKKGKCDTANESSTAIDQSEIINENVQVTPESPVESIKNISDFLIKQTQELKKDTHSKTLNKVDSQIDAQGEIDKSKEIENGGANEEKMPNEGLVDTLLRTEQNVSVEEHKIKEKKPSKKIILKRPSTEIQTHGEKKVSKKISLKRNILNSKDNNKEHLDEAKAEWSSAYDIDICDEVKDTGHLRQRKNILKRSTTVEEPSLSKESDYPETKRRLSLMEPGDNKNSMEKSLTGKKIALRPSAEISEKAVKIFVPIKINRNILNKSMDTCSEDSSAKCLNIKQRKWESKDSFNHLPIDVKFLKGVCSELELPSENEVNLKVDERRTSTNMEEYEQEEKLALSSDIEKESIDQNIIAINRKISIVDDTASKLQPPPSPAKNTVSDVLFITNLVRPFTVKQLKELLERTGRITSDGFWTDRIKSMCYVHYHTVEEAEATRNALHGINWPIGNGKKLNIEYATLDDLEKAKHPPLPTVVKEKTPEKEYKVPNREGTVVTHDLDNKHRREREQENDRGRSRDAYAKRSDREWDIGKDNGRNIRSRSRSFNRGFDTRHTHRNEDYSIKRTCHEPPPQKMMDDLFQKTKSTPSIYWQPLSPNEIAMKQQQRLVRMEEHKRRLEETKKRPRNPVAVHYRRR